MSLAQLLAVQARGGDLFEGHAPQDGWKRIFGGLVAAQALAAAQATAEGRPCHSLHCYFLRPGDPALPIDYAVERLRDGASFSARRVDAAQAGRLIFSLMASFQREEPGLAYQLPMPDAPAPESLPDEAQRWRTFADTLPDARRAMQPPRVEVRRVQPSDVLVDPSPFKQVWMRSLDPLPAGDPALHHAALVYGSDMTLLAAATSVHGLGFWSSELQTASLDHSVWLHRPTDFNDWHLYVQEAPSTFGGRGLAQGRMYRRDGTLVASMAQEGLMRLRP